MKLRSLLFWDGLELDNDTSSDAAKKRYEQARTGFANALKHEGEPGGDGKIYGAIIELIHSADVLARLL